MEAHLPETAVMTSRLDPLDSAEEIQHVFLGSKEYNELLLPGELGRIMHKASDPGCSEKLVII